MFINNRQLPKTSLQHVKILKIKNFNYYFCHQKIKICVLKIFFFYYLSILYATLVYYVVGLTMNIIHVARNYIRI